MWLAWWLACGAPDGPSVGGTPLHEVPLVAPWSMWLLPVGDGRVITSDAGLLTVRYPGLRVEELGRAWRAAFTAAGFTETLEHAEGGLVAVRLEHGPGQLLELSLLPRGDATVVSAVLAPPWSDEGAAVAPDPEVVR